MISSESKISPLKGRGKKEQICKYVRYVQNLPHQVFIDEHCQLREGRAADLMLPMNLKAPENAGKEPRNSFSKKITCNNLETREI